MKEIKTEEIIDYINPLLFEENPAIAVASDGKETNGLTIGWAGFGILWQKQTATVYVHKNRYSKHIFDNAQYFSICFMKDENKGQLKYFGTVSGRDENKMLKCGMTVNTKNKAPFFEESSLVIICKMMGKCDFISEYVDDGVKDWYSKTGVHTQYFGQIVTVLKA